MKTAIARVSRTRTLTAAGLATAAAGLVVTMPPAPASAAVGPIDAACGTWVLQQVSSASDLEKQAPKIDAALAENGVTGFSMRLPWSSLDADWSLLDKGLAIAKKRNKPFSVRFMAGRYTPKRVFDAGAYSFVAKAGYRVPQPFSPEGVAGNPVFEKEFDAAVSKLASWARNNGVTLLHLPWYGFQWAEIYNGDEIESRPNYSWDAWLAGHKKLVQIGFKYSGSDLAVEFPVSGHWGTRKTGSNETADMIVSVAGSNSPRVLVQGNGMGKNNGSTTNRPLAHAKQMYDGTSTYNWADIYTTLSTNNEEYLEVYTSSFEQSNRASLVSEAAKFKAKC